MLADLRSVGAPLHPLSDEELWHRIKKRALDRFTDATTTIIGRARQRRWTGEDLRHELGHHAASTTRTSTDSSTSSAELLEPTLPASRPTRRKTSPDSCGAPSMR